MKTIKYMLFCGTALVAVSWTTPIYDISGKRLGFSLQTDGVVYRSLASFDRRDLIMSTVVLFLTTSGANTWVRPINCPATLNSVECIGGGASGGFGTATKLGASQGVGGGGGAYAKEINVAVGATESYEIANDVVSADLVPTNGEDTWFLAVGTVFAQGGQGSTGGAAAASVGSTKFNGGNGSIVADQGGGGGAAGLNAVGGNSSGIQGAAGDGGFGGAGGIAATQGSPGAEWTSTANARRAGSGGGGGAGSSVGIAVGGAGGLYGGGGGAGFGTGILGGNGTRGIIVIMFEPVPTPPEGQGYLVQ